MPDHDLWPGVARHLRAQVTPQEFETWFAPLSMRLEEQQAIFTVPNRFFAQWIGDRYSALLGEALTLAAGMPLDASFEVARARPAPPVANQHNSPAQPQGLNLNPAYVFDSFVVGPCNELAHAASQAVADNPGRQYNPLTIFGGSGLGKTHLVSAVGNNLAVREASNRVHYTSSEAYSNELIQAVRYDGIQSFRDKYRLVDCLIIEDIQFLSGRERTQEEFFHTFESLFQAGKQIVLTSDKLPRDIPGLAGRLRTRFEWGLLADLQTPDTETKIAILQRKAADKNLALSRQVAAYLAKQPESSVRVLEGYLNRLMAVSSLRGQEADLELARQVVGPLASERQVSVEDVFKAVAAHYGLKVSDLKSARKSRDISRPRQVAMYLARRLTNLSFPEIGKALGGKDHSTVVKGVQRVKGLMAQDPELTDTVRAVENAVRAGKNRD
ncbi:MAG: chromosomal replication initiator protein DnaA [Desulfarculaceae bacterium]|nr:chromosomal replication initiator protein DnaA [Desulfarculaceae bacterium]MCF8074333.1 chromosomal replication initiator protein DnaA [Desulfarculaceae bacterium]MCF8103567.1 chromosomal replication initiator protein DnaA [Desulfarculaceae bacterium]MCF8117334.1 chromosomal replication initiator protein DnaA [Desulfarculaceae bacterium]